MSARVAVVGAGALGQLTGALLAGAGRVEVTVISRRPGVVDAIRRHGIEVRRPLADQPSLTAHPRVAGPQDVPRGYFDLVLLLHKSYDTAWATGVGQRLAAADGAIVALQNGLGPAAELEAADPRGVAGVIYQGAAYVAPGVVAHTVLGPLVAAPRPPLAGRMSALLDELSGPEFPVRLHPDRDAMLWEKAVNAVSNAVSGALLLPVRDITRSASAWAVMEAARAEVLAIAAARGVGVDRAWLHERFAGRPVARVNLGSTYQSLRSGRTSEIGAFVAELEALGDESGVPTPVLGTLRLLVRAREELSG